MIFIFILMRVILTSKTHQGDTTQNANIKAIFPVAFDCKAIYLSSVSIPYSFYNVRETNNTVIIDNTTYQITPKNYNSIQLATALNSILPLDVSCIYDRQTLKFKVVNNSTASISIQFSTSFRLFGFDNKGYNIVVNTQLESNNVSDINDGLQALILTSNISNAFSTLFNDKFGTSIISRLPIGTSKPGSILFYNDTNNTQPIVKNVKSLQYIEINVYDDDLLPISLNGVQFQVELFIDLETEITVPFNRLGRILETEQNTKRTTDK